MKILFLDIDGVLNHLPGTPYMRKHPCGYPVITDSDKVEMVNKMTENHGIKVVLSSSWRKIPVWKEMMRANGILYVEDTIPNEYGDADRGKDIQSWLDSHQGVSKYAILDDQSTNTFLPHQVPNLFQTRFSVGLTKEIAESVLSYLKD